MSDNDKGLRPQQEIRAIAVREANVYFGWVAQFEKTVDLGPRDASIRLGQVLEAAEHIAKFIETGERPNGA